MLFLFFKQKTAYEMRISDWSSDVCSSDLKAQSPDAELFGAENRGDDDVAPGLEPTVGAQPDAVAEAVERENLIDFGQAHFPRRAGIFDAGLGRGAGAASVARDEDDVGVRLGDPGSHRADARRADQLHADARSEEHTSELQSLMRISYAVFCLKKKIQTQQYNKQRNAECIQS